MAAGTIIRAWQDSANAYLAVLVDEGAPVGKVEYIGSVSRDQLAGLTAAQQKAALVAACKAVRDSQRATAADLGLSGGVTL